MVVSGKAWNGPLLAIVDISLPTKTRRMIMATLLYTASSMLNK